MRLEPDLLVRPIIQNEISIVEAVTWLIVDDGGNNIHKLRVCLGEHMSNGACAALKEEQILVHGACKYDNLSSSNEELQKSFQRWFYPFRHSIHVLML